MYNYYVYKLILIGFTTDINSYLEIRYREFSYVHTLDLVNNFNNYDLV